MEYFVRIDGNVLDVMPSHGLWEESEGVVLALTGGLPGSDQGSVIAFDSKGRRISRWCPSNENPYGVVQRQQPLEGHAREALIGGRPILLVAAGGLMFPSSYSVLTRSQAEKFVERVRIWNPGSIICSATDGRYLAFMGANNRLPGKVGIQYPIAVGVVDLERALSGPDESVVVMEAPGGPEAEARGFERYFGLPFQDAAGDPLVSTILIQNGIVRAPVGKGLEFRADLLTGRFDFLRRPWSPDPYGESEPPVGSAPKEADLEALRNEVISWPDRK